MNTLSFLLIDDDTDEHEIFMISVEKNFDCSASWCAYSIQQAIARFEAGETPLPEHIFVDWGVIRHDPVANLSLLKSIFPHLANRIYVISGVIPLINPLSYGIPCFYKKQDSIELYAAMIRDVASMKSAISAVV